jgi:hypothetical protein
VRQLAATTEMKTPQVAPVWSVTSNVVVTNNIGTDPTVAVITRPLDQLDNDQCEAVPPYELTRLRLRDRDVPVMSVGYRLPTLTHPVSWVTFTLPRLLLRGLSQS